MEWFKYMKHIQGSASTKTFEQIKSINRSGTYTIGNTGQDFDSYLSNEAELKNGILLEVYTKRTARKQRMTLKEIEDLQSSLMLLGREARGGAENHDEAETEKNYFIQVRFLRQLKSKALFQNGHMTISPYSPYVVIGQGTTKENIINNNNDILDKIVLLCR